jgi:hypothetical protein
MQAKMTSSSPKVTFDEIGQLIDIEKTPVRACAEGEIELTSYCATVVCAYTQTLTLEEAAQMVKEEQRKTNAGNSLLDSQ